MTGLTGNQVEMAWGKRMFESGCFLVLASNMAVFAGIHAVVQVVSDRFLDGIPLSHIMSLIARMAGEAVQALRVMDIRFRAPLATSPFSIGHGVAGATIFVTRCSHNLKVKIFEIGHL